MSARVIGLIQAVAVITAAALGVALLDGALVEASTAGEHVASAVAAHDTAQHAASALRQPAQPLTDTAGALTPSAPTPLAPIGLLSPTVALTDDVSAGGLSETSPAAQPAAAEDELLEGQPLLGTIVSNRTNYAARFFVEGHTYRVEPFASAALELPRDTAVLTLFACDASTSESQDGCYWDPYLLQRDGFYEVFDDSIIVGLPSLMLRNALAPPENQVWIHNRTGITESVVFRDVVYDVAPGAVQEYDVQAGAPVIVYVRSCGSLNGSEVCEWAPDTLVPGAYYAMLEVSTPGVTPGCTIITVDLRPVLDTSGEAVAAPAVVVCQLRVPAINIRTGPGLQYQIVGKVREDGSAPATVSITGRSADGLWYAVSESVAANGWVTSAADFIACQEGAGELPIAEFIGGALAQTPTPLPAPLVVQATPQPPAVEAGDGEEIPSAPTEEPPLIVDEPPADAATPEPESPEPDAPAPTIPEGLAQLVVNNGFQYPVRFTVDQIYRPIEGPSEFDLEPGTSTSVFVFPGTVAFTASSPWNGLSGNAVVETAADQAIVLWLRFQQDPEDSSSWELAWQ